METRDGEMRGREGRLAEREEILVLCSSDVCLQHHSCNKNCRIRGPSVTGMRSATVGEKQVLRGRVMCDV